MADTPRVRKPLDDGFERMINAEPSAKESPTDAIAEIIRAYRPEKQNDRDLASQVIEYLRDGDIILG